MTSPSSFYPSLSTLPSPLFLSSSFPLSLINTSFLKFFPNSIPFLFPLHVIFFLSFHFSISTMCVWVSLSPSPSCFHSHLSSPLLFLSVNTRLADRERKIIQHDFPRASRAGETLKFIRFFDSDQGGPRWCSTATEHWLALVRWVYVYFAMSLSISFFFYLSFSLSLIWSVSLVFSG